MLDKHDIDRMLSKPSTALAALGWALVQSMLGK